MSLIWRGSDKPNTGDAAVLVAGQRVSDMTAAVDGYCNFALSIPIEALWPAFKAKKPAFRARQVRHAQSTPWRRLQAQVMDSGPVQSFLTDGLRRTDRVQLLADPPDKAFGRHTARWIITAIASVHDATKTDLRQTTSYVVPGNTGLASVTGLAKAHSKKCEAVFGVKCASKHKVKAAPLIHIKNNPL